MASPVFRSAQSDPVDLACLADDLRSAYPQLGAIAPLRLLGVGFGGVVVVTARGEVIRIARNRPAMEGYAREAWLLPTLSAWLPVAIPVPRRRLDPTARFPYGALGYPLLPGTPLAPERLAAENLPTLAADLAAVLLALHRFPLAEALALGALSRDERADHDARLAEQALAILAGEVSPDAFGEAQAIASKLLHGAYSDAYAPSLIHGDLWYDNILVDDEARHVEGIVDFERAAVGDPAEDFAALNYAGSAFVAETLAAYRALGGDLGAHLDERIAYHWQAREFLGVGFAAQHDPAELPEAIAKLSALL